MNILLLQHDYRHLSLSGVGEPVQIVERVVLDYRVVEGMEGVMDVDEQAIDGSLMTEQEMSGTVFEEEEPVAVLVEEQPLDSVFFHEEPMVGVFDPGDDP